MENRPKKPKNGKNKLWPTPLPRGEVSPWFALRCSPPPRLGALPLKPQNQTNGPHGLDFANAKSVFNCLAGLAPTSPLMPEKRNASSLPAPHADKLRPSAFTVRLSVRHSPPLSSAVTLLLSRCPCSASCHADEGQHQHSPSEPKDGYSTITQRTDAPDILD